MRTTHRRPNVHLREGAACKRGVHLTRRTRQAFASGSRRTLPVRNRPLRAKDRVLKLKVGEPTSARAGGPVPVPDKDEKTLGEIEQTQAALRESIEDAKQMAEKSERLLKKYREEKKKLPPKRE